MSSRNKSNPDSQEIPDDEAESGDLGPGSAGQSGDLQDIPDDETGSESVRELLEEGQYFEASVLEGIENAPLADAKGIRTREVNEDDVPLEYLEDEDPPNG